MRPVRTVIQAISLADAENANRATSLAGSLFMEMGIGHSCGCFCSASTDDARARARRRAATGCALHGMPSRSVCMMYYICATLIVCCLRCDSEILRTVLAFVLSARQCACVDRYKANIVYAVVNFYIDSICDFCGRLCRDRLFTKAAKRCGNPILFAAIAHSAAINIERTQIFSFQL